MFNLIRLTNLNVLVAGLATAINRKNSEYKNRIHEVHQNRSNCV